MKKAQAADVQGGRTESRFAILTSGLLARKGTAAPSNAPIADPAEETTPFAPDPPPPARAAKPAPRQAEPIAATMTVINERSAEAGYPDNPTLEEIEAFEAGLDEAPPVAAAPPVPAPAPQRAPVDDAFLDEERAAPQSPFDPEDAPLSPPTPIAHRIIEMQPQRPAGKGERRAAVTFRMNTRDFLRLKLGAAELNMPAQDVIIEALEEYLDARGVESLRGCVCLEKSAAAMCAAPCADAAERE
jgi:hypothetical protein